MEKGWERNGEGERVVIYEYSIDGVEKRKGRFTQWFTERLQRKKEFVNRNESSDDFVGSIKCK